MKETKEAWNGQVPWWSPEQPHLILGSSRLLRSVSIQKWPVAGPVTHSIEQLPSIHPSLMSDTLRATSTSTTSPQRARVSQDKPRSFSRGVGSSIGCDLDGDHRPWKCLGSSEEVTYFSPNDSFLATIRKSTIVVGLIKYCTKVQTKSIVLSLAINIRCFWRKLAR